MSSAFIPRHSVCGSTRSGRKPTQRATPEKEKTKHAGKHASSLLQPSLPQPHGGRGRLVSERVQDQALQACHVCFAESRSATQWWVSRYFSSASSSCAGANACLGSVASREGTAWQLPTMSEASSSSCIEKPHREALPRSFIGSDRAELDTATSAHHAIEPRHY
jgi:hypothetical protein